MKLRLLSLIAWALAWVTPSVQAQTFTLAGSNPMPTLQFGGRIFFIDVDTDGDQDLLSQNGSTVGTGIELRINNGNGTFAAPIAAAAPSGTFSSGPLNGISFSAVTTFSTVSLFAVDVDDDGHTDIVEATSAAAGRWIRNNGNGTFTSQASPFPTLPFSPRMLFGDWNGDGAIDLLYQSGSTAGTDIALMLNNGNGTFASAITAAAPSGTFSSGPFSGISFTAITVASTTSFWWLDYDKDGDRDLVEQISSIAGRVIRNNGGGSWSVVATPFPTLSFASRMIFGDFESDGDLDILYQNGNTSGTGWNVQLNNGNGTYAAAISAPATGTFASGPFSGHTFTQYPSPANIYMLDLDKDGDHDLIEQVNNVAGPLRLQNGSPPVLASTIPADNATGVAVNSNITLTFDRSVTKGTGNILIRQTNVGNTLFESIPVTSGLVTGSGTTWVINPTSNLATTTAYSITIDAGAFVDGSSKALHEVSGKLTLNFTSGAALSNNADLSALALTTATINEAFAAATTAYTSNVANATSSVTVTPTAAQANATIEARVGANAFASVTSGSPSASLALAVGPNTIDVRVTAQDGTTIKTYTVTVTRAAPPVAIATNDLMVIAYNSSEDVPVDSIALLATADIPNGTTIFLTDRGWQTSTTSLRPTSLLENTVTWVTSGVTAGKIIRIATGTPNSTTIGVSDVVASFIGTSYGSLSGSLDPDLTAGDQMLIYTTADNNKDSTPTFIHAFNADAPRLFNTLNDDTPLDGWSDSDTSNLNNTSKLPPGLTAVLTTGDGGSGFGIANYVNSGTDEFDNYIYNGPTSQTTRALWITRITTFANWLGRDTTTYDTQTAGALTPTNFLIGSLSSNADLASLSTTAGSITFSAATTAYALNVPNGTTTTTVTATRAEANATLEVRVNSGSYAPLTSGVASGNLALTVGANPIDVRVTAQDGTTQKTYTITVTRAPIPPNLSINDVTLSEGNTGSTTFAFTVSLSAPAPVGGVSFNIATANGTATQPGDYTLNSQAAQTIPAASSTYSFNVSVIGDTDVETNETFFVNVTSVSGAVVTDGQGLGTITNDDVATPPSITSVSPARGPIAGGTTVVITGTGFTGATAVNFGSTPATSYTVNSPTQITATLPAGTGGIFDISVTAGTGTGTGSGLFYYFTTSGGSPAMAASKVDIFTPNGAGKVLPGAPIQYRTLIANTGGGDATAVDFADAIPANTTLVPGSVNVSPLAEDNVYSTIVNTQLAAGSPTVLSGPLVTSAVKVTDNDREFLTDTFTISTFDGTSAAGGSVVMVTSGGNAGSFTYVPPAGFVGVDSFTYTLRDDGTDSTAGNADDLTGIGTVVINVSEADTVASGTQKVWYIDNSYAGANGTENGTSARPFNDLSDVTGATGPDIAGDTLHLALGADYAGGITLLADQTLVGEGVALVLNGITLAPLNDKAVITNGSGAGITLATNNTIRGVEVRNTSTVDILGTAVGNLTISATSCTGTGGILTVSTSGALNVSLDEATTTASGTTGIDINTCTGTLTVASGTLAGITSTDVNINAGTVAVSIAASINNTSGRPVLIQNHAIGAITLSGNIGSSVSGTGILVQNNISGTITFSGSSQVINTGNNSAVSLTSNSGATVSFTGGGLDIDTTSAAAFTATGGGTVNVTGANNTLTTTTAAALNVTNTTIGASGLTFRSISSSGGTSNGIILDTTGTSGGLTVTGDGTNTSPGGNSSGGTIANKSGADGNTTQGIGIYLNNTRDVVLRRMTISGVNQNFGIRGFGVTNFTLQYCTVGSPTPTNSGSIAANLQGTNNSSIGEGAIYFGSQTDGILGLTGTASIDNCFISAGRTDNMQLSNGGGTLNRLVITNSTFGYNFTGTPAANAALTVVARRASSGNTLLNSTVTGCTFVGTPGNAANFTGQEPTTTLGIAMDTIFQNNTITNDHLQNFLGGSNITIAGFSSTTFNISNNSLRDANGSAITLQMGAPGAGSTVATALSGTIHNNTIGVNGVPDSGSVSGNGIFFSFADNTTAPKGQVNLAVTNNIVRNYSGNAGIYADNTGGNYDLNFTCTSNVTAEPGPGAFAGLALAAGGPTTNDDIDIFARITGNNFSTGDPTNSNDIIVGGGANGASTIKLAGAGGPADGVAFASLAAVQTFLFNNNNTAGTVASAYTDAPATVAMFLGAGATNPPLPSTLLFAEELPPMPVKDRSDLNDVIEVSAVKTVKKAPKAPQGRFAPQAALTQATLEKLAAQAISRWEAAGLTPAQKQRLQALRFELSDLNTLHLGQASGDLIQISRTAAGNAWFIDETPSDDAEFERRTGFQPVSSDNGLKVRSTIQGVDLLTTLMHEMGHSLGLPDRYDLRSRRSIMYGHLSTGERRLPAPGEAAGATPFTDDTTRLLGATINIGTLPAGKSVTIVGTVLVNDPANTQLISSQGTVSGSNFTSILTDDPAFAGTTNPTTTPVERPDAAVVSLNRASGSPRSAATATWQIVFDQPVSGLTSANFAAVNGGLGGVITVSEPTELSGPPSTTWNITVTTGTGSGTLGLNLVNDSGSLSHDITNQPFTGQVYTIDKIAPVFSSITRQPPSAQNTNADTLVFRATFSEAVLGVDAADFTVSGTTATITSVSGTGPYDITVSGGDLANLNGTVGLALAGAQNIADTAGNPLPGTAPATNETYTVDNTAPTVAISSATGNPAANAVIPVTVQFSETVTGFDLTDITVGNGSKGNFVAVDGDTYTFDLTPSGPGVTVTADVAGSAAQDAAGNNNSAATQFTRSIVDAVSIAATTATAAEGGATGLYTFTRGDSTGALTVSFQLDASSTATAATDFNLTSTGTLTFNTGTGAGTIVIPNGQLTATVTLTALAETPNPAEAAETARLNVVAASGYVAGSPANATVTITENSFLVTTTANSGEGSLRQAVLNANSIAGTDTITFSDGAGGTVNFTDSTADTITLAAPLLISSSLTIRGTSAAQLILSGNMVFISSGDVILAGLSIISSPVRGLEIRNGTTSVALLGVTVSGNSMTNSAGGGLFQEGSAGNLTIINSTFSGNNTLDGGNGGGLQLNSSGTKSIINSTISGNIASNEGGGIRSISGPLTLINCTVTNNQRFGSSGGIISGVSATSVVNISNCLIAGNVNNTTLPDVGGAFTSGGGNLIGNAGTATGFTNGVNSDQVGSGASPINPQLAALANNGGPTQTHALLSGSPALNAGLNAQIPVDTFDLDGDTNVAEPLPFDQRGTGFIRAIGTVDIGAFELQKSVSILADAASAAEGTLPAGNTAFTFTVSRTGDTTGAVTMDYAVSGAAVNATDFGGTLPSGTVTIPDSSANTTLTINVSKDATVEPNEAFTVTLSNANNGYVVSGAPATSTINNDDAATVTVAKVNDGAETPPGSVVFRITQTAAASSPTSITYTVGGTATNGSDYIGVPLSALIPAGQTTADIFVLPTDDALVEATETLSVTLTGFTARDPEVTLGATLTATADITDNDSATVTIAKINDGAETPSSALFRVTQTAVASTDTTLSYTIGGTATSGSDFTALSGTVTIPANSTTADISVTISNDALVEATETIALTLTGFTARDADVSLVATVTATADITDNDTATVTIAKINDAAEPSTNGLFRVTQTAQSSTNTVVTYAVTGTATSGSDFTALSGSMTILAGNTTADISLPVIDENLVEATETVIATLNGFTARDADITLGATVAATVNITDNDSATVTLAKITDGVEATVPTNALFRVTQTNPASVNTVISYTVGGTATSGSDFTALSGSVTILAGNTTADISVAVLDENVVEATETVSLTLTSITAGDADVTLGATLTAAADITDSDTSVITLAVVNADRNEGTGGGTTAFTFSASLSNPVQGGFSIAYSTNDGTALAGSDYTDNDSTLTFTGTASESKTITVLVTHDGTNELDENFTVTLGSITGTTLGASLSTAGSPQTGTIRNDDALTISVTAPDASADENSVGTGTWRVSRNGVLGNTTVQLAIDASSTAVAADWTQSGATFASLAPGSAGTIVIPAGDTFVEFTLTPSADIHAEAAETVRLNITTDAAYTLGSPANATITIVANDFVVINTNNAGEGTLRQAVLNANAIAGTDTITFEGSVFTDATADEITLSTGELTSNTTMSIRGTGTNLLTLRNTAADSRVIVVGAGGTTITDLTITGGNTTTPTKYGGGIYAGSSLTLRNVAVVGNSTVSRGGGIYHADINMRIVNCTVSGNSAGVRGGGISGESFGAADIVNSTVSGNTSAEGGGLHAERGNIAILQSTITNNTTSSGSGSVSRVTSTVNVRNSLIAANVANATTPDVSGTFTSGGGNVIGNVGTATGFTGTNDLTGTGASPVNPLLGPLQDNGGPTLTHMLLNGSPAINNGLIANISSDNSDVDGDSIFAEAMSVDQRGTPNLRQRGPAPDAGAVEAFAFEPTITATTTDEDTQSTSGLVISANTADGGLTTHYQISEFIGGFVFKNDGTTLISTGEFITKAEGAAGLKFTPNANANSANTPGFSFTIQAAVGATAGDLRGTTVPVAITVNAVNDVPTVVAPGLPDIRITIGDAPVIPLGANFEDVDLHTLTFTVSGNTVPAKASAAITGGTNVTVTGLTYGVTDITIMADDSNGGTVTDTFQVAVGTVEPTPTMPATPTLGWRVNTQTNLFDIDVPVQNTTAFDINGFRLTVDLSAYAVSHPTLRLINHSSPAGVLPAYVDYPFPVAIGETVNVRLSFFVATRVMPNPFNPTLTVTRLTTSAVAGPLPVGPTFVQAVIQKNEAGRILLTWPSTPGRWYRIFYSANLTSWTPSATPIQASANQVQWIDSGAPFTQTPPAGSRYYMVTEIPAPAPAPPP